MLSHRSVFDYLVKRGLMTRATAVDDDLVIVDVSRRNHNFKVRRRHGPGFVVKQSASTEEAATVAREGSAYQFLQSTLPKQTFDRHFIRCYGYDATERALVLEFAENSTSLDDCYLHRARFPPHFGAQIGRALATLHGATRAHRDQPTLALLPWVFSLEAPPVAALRDLSGANLQLLKIVQSSNEFCQRLAALRGKWRIGCTIHGDVKSSNCLVIRAKVGDRARARIKLIDWELAMRGDPGWDVGSMFQDYLAIWINSIPVIGSEGPERFVELATYPIEKIQPALRSFWRTYRESVGVPEFASQEFLVRSVEYAGARLVQHVYEQAQYQSQLAGTSIYALQVSLNILQRPHEALVHLFGIPLAGDL